MRKFFAPLLVVVAALMVVQAGATVVTSIPGGTVITMPAINYLWWGPSNLWHHQSGYVDLDKYRQRE